MPRGQAATPRGAGTPIPSMELGREHGAQPEDSHGCPSGGPGMQEVGGLTLLAGFYLPLLPGWWRRQWKSLCPMPKLPSVFMPGGWVPYRRCSPPQTGARPCRGEGLGRYAAGSGRTGCWGRLQAPLQPRSGAGLSPAPAASSLSPWSGSWKAAGDSARLSGSWHPPAPLGPAPSRTYRSCGSAPGLSWVPSPAPPWCYHGAGGGIWYLEVKQEGSGRPNGSPWLGATGLLPPLRWLPPPSMANAILGLS